MSQDEPTMDEVELGMKKVCNKGRCPLSCEVHERFFLNRFCLKKRLRHKKVSREQKKVEGYGIASFLDQPITLQ